MWRLLLLAFVLPLGMLTTSCSDDDDDKVPGSKSELVGKWKLTSEEYWYKENGQIVETSNGKQDVNYNYTIEFKADGTCVVTDEGYTESAEWKYSGGKIYVKEDDENWSDVDEGATVLKLTDTVLEVESHEKYKDDGVNCEDYGWEKYTRIS